MQREEREKVEEILSLRERDGLAAKEERAT